MPRYIIITVALILGLAACTGDQPSLEAFCEADNEVAVFEAPRNMAGTSEAARTAIDSWVTNAPEEIRPQVEMWATRLTRLIDVWEAGDFDEAKIDQEEFDAAFESFFAADLDAASNDVIAWVSANCTTRS